MKTLVLGASENSSRLSNIAIKRLLEHEHKVVAVSNKPGKVNSIIFSQNLPSAGIDTVTMYLNPKNQGQYTEDLLSLNPRRVIFNPGSENEILEKELIDHGIKVENACTLVLLSIDNY